MDMACRSGKLEMYFMFCVLDFFLCGLDLMEKTAFQELQMSLYASSLCFDGFKFFSIVRTHGRRVPPQFCTCVLQSASQQPPFTTELF